MLNSGAPGDAERSGMPIDAPYSMLKGKQTDAAQAWTRAEHLVRDNRCTQHDHMAVITHVRAQGVPAQ